MSCATHPGAEWCDCREARIRAEERAKTLRDLLSDFEERTRRETPTCLPGMLFACGLIRLAIGAKEAPKLTTLETNVLHWLRAREEMPTAADLLAEFPDNQRETLLRTMRRLVSLGLAVAQHQHWTVPGANEAQKPVCTECGGPHDVSSGSQCPPRERP